jgi:hypothetical protein
VATHDHAPHLDWLSLVSDNHAPYKSNRPRDRVGLLHRVEVDDPISMGRLCVGVNLLSRRDGAARPMVVEVRLQGNVFVVAVVAPVRVDRGGRVRLQPDLPQHIPDNRVVPRRHDGLKL